MQGVRESRSLRRWRRHLGRDTPRRWVWALPRRRGEASAILLRALFLPDDSLPCMHAADVRWVPAVEQFLGPLRHRTRSVCDV